MFGMDLDSDRLIASLGPPGMRRSMIDELFDYPADIQSLPGPWATNAMEDNTYGNEDAVSHLAEFLKVGPTSRHQGHDPGWKNKSHHALRRVKTREDLDDLANDFQSTLKRALAYETSRLRDWMKRHGYRKKEIDTYQRTGGLPLVLTQITRYYQELLTTIRTNALKYGGTWSRSLP